MRVRSLAAACVVLACVGFGANRSARAQGLIWQLPAVGEMVHFEGTYKQTNFRPSAGGADGGNVVAEWISHLTIKSLSRENAEYAGKMQPCRWLEFKVINGKSVEGLDPGPVGTRIYRVLVPESGVINGQVDADKIPVAFLPIVKGMRKFGDKEVLPLESHALQVYPTISLLMPYRTLKEEKEAGDLQIRLGEETSAAKKPVKTTILKGAAQMEDPISRSKNEATIWRSNEMAFGLAKWEVTLNVWTKDRKDPPDEFKPYSKVEVEMHAVYQKGNAEPDPLLP